MEIRWLDSIVDGDYCEGDYSMWLINNRRTSRLQSPVATQREFRTLTCLCNSRVIMMRIARNLQCRIVRAGCVNLCEETKTEEDKRSTYEIIPASRLDFRILATSMEYLTESKACISILKFVTR